MTPKTFVHNVYDNCVKHAADDMEQSLIDPPGRSPSRTLVMLSEWYRSKPEEERELIRLLVTLSARDALFGMLCALDGVARIDEGDEPGSFELNYLNGDEKSVLTSETSQFLHELVPDVLEY